MAEPRPIGGGWMESKDPNSGRNYYANTVTMATSWTWPEDVPRLDEWTSAVDPGSGRTYYTNAAKGETSWEKPAGFVEKAAAAPAPAAAATPAAAAAPAAKAPVTDWVAAEDPGTGRTYYSSPSTGDTVWDKPAGFVDPNAPPAAPAAPSAVPPAAAAAKKKAGFADNPVESTRPAHVAQEPSMFMHAVGHGGGGGAAAEEKMAEKKGVGFGFAEDSDDDGKALPGTLGGGGSGGGGSGGGGETRGSEDGGERGTWGSKAVRRKTLAADKSTPEGEPSALKLLKTVTDPRSTAELRIECVFFLL